jgi:GntR family transcriptional regulator, transcriptional repressor for pyruvate dehydrogenase complex
MVSDRQGVIDRFKEVTVKKPADVIIRQINGLITSGVLKPGDRLPAERTFAEKFGVGRGHVREALKRLEFYGVLKTLPQSGTYVATLGVNALERLAAHAIDAEKDNPGALLETRLILEVNGARLAAEHADRKDLIELIRVHEIFRMQVKNGDAGMAEDHRFHHKIAALSQNPVLCSLITLMARSTQAYLYEKDNNPNKFARITLREHEAIVQAIKQKDPDQAALAMEEHMESLLDRFSNK